ncbi:MAG: hypothetical protein Q8R92_14415 [Deltaproteobacteria bacterium]|nr:hypothetical protein [Deltaproteobacteria bacterium]
MPTPAQLAGLPLLDALNNRGEEFGGIGEPWEATTWADQIGATNEGFGYFFWAALEGTTAAARLGGTELPDDCAVSLELFPEPAGEPAEGRYFEVWLRMETESQQGWRLRASPLGGGLHKLVLSLWIEGAEQNPGTYGLTLEEVALEEDGAIGLAIEAGVVSVWGRAGAEGEWEELGSPEGDAELESLPSKFAGVGAAGNANPIVRNFSGGEVGEEAPKTVDASAAGTGVGTGAATAKVLTPGGEAFGETLSFTTELEPRVAVVQEYPPDRLAWSVSPPGGAPNRWAADEPDPANVIDDITLTSEMPGGYKEATGTLARDPRRDYRDLAAYGDISIYEPGVEEIWNGRLEKASEASGERQSIRAECAGWQVALEDDKAVIGPGFIDGDLSKWGEPSTERRLQLIEAGIRLMASTSVGHSSKDLEAAAAAIINDFTNVETVATDTEAGEAHYYGGGVDIGAVRYDTKGDLAGGGASADWESNVGLGTTDTFSVSEIGSDHDASAATNQTVEAPGAGYKFARIRNRLAVASEGVDLARIFSWPNLRVLGDHGLAAQGTWPNVGFTASQMLEYAIPLYATPLTVDSELLEDDGFVIPQAWFAEPGPMSAVVDELTRYGLFDWFVYGGKLFQLRAPGVYGRTWKAYTGPSGLEEVGVDAQRLWRSIVVRWADVDGRTLTAGPPGSGADVETEALEVTDPDHPAVKAGLTRTDVLDIGGICTEEPAIAAGERWLEEANALSRAGQASLSGYALDDKSVYRPVAQVRAGDLISFADSPDTSPRRITAVSYSHRSRTASITIDAPPGGVAALLERFKATLSTLGL